MSLVKYVVLILSRHLIYLRFLVGFEGGFQSRSGQTKVLLNWYLFLLSFRIKTKWSDMSTRGLLIQRASTIARYLTKRIALMQSGHRHHLI